MATPLKVSSGLVLYRFESGRLQFLLVHPGGPFWRKKDEGAWTIPKGEIQEGEEPLATAQREFEEELGFMPEGQFLPLSPVRLKGGKLIYAWAIAGNCRPEEVRSNTFALEWPPRSGKTVEFPEIDRAAFFSLEAAATKINPAQLPLLQEAANRLEPGEAKG